MVGRFDKAKVFFTDVLPFCCYKSNQHLHGTWPAVRVKTAHPPFFLTNFLPCVQYKAAHFVRYILRAEKGVCLEGVDLKILTFSEVQPVSCKVSSGVARWLDLTRNFGAIHISLVSLQC